MRMSERIRNLERKTHIEVLPDLIIEVLEDGMVEIYGDKEGEKVRMTEAEYSSWAKRYQKKRDPVDITIEMGEWDLEE
ncbi:hypothetical protein [uncultured Trichococcus sp.]|uniref:hypothetical protein n=1 Tax=uncultured Trichococcus sp. TaxID=189665 RepID=UPI0029C7C6EF|nr:hypothetical protein [uncultured Trichococcus sp.]